MPESTVASLDAAHAEATRPRGSIGKAAKAAVEAAAGEVLAEAPPLVRLLYVLLKPLVVGLITHSEGRLVALHHPEGEAPPVPPADAARPANPAEAQIGWPPVDLDPSHFAQPGADA